MKKILLLGGSHQQIVAIKKAKELGYYTVLCDYLSDNPGQYHADRFYQISTTDKDAVLQIAKKENIDAVVAYASDPAAPTAAYISEKMGIPGNPYRSVEILCNKDKFRSFLSENGFYSPNAKGFSRTEKSKIMFDNFEFPIIIKPVDSSGSKGVTILHDKVNALKAVDFAFEFSRSGRIVIENFIEKKHQYLIGGDIFVVDGKVVLWGLLNCHRDQSVNPLVPVGKSFPPCVEDVDMENVKKTISSIVQKLGIKFGAMNVELVVDSKGRVWPIDIGPRNGGNMIPELLGMIYDVDLVELTIKAAMGEKGLLGPKKEKLYYATHNIHSAKDGILDKVQFSSKIEPYIVKTFLYKQSGDSVEYFDDASKAIGIVFFHFDSRNKMFDILDNINEHIEVVTKECK
jgi:biotin carboxylase